MPKIVLSAFFYVVLTPVALLVRRLGHDPMGLRQWKRSSDSAFVDREHRYCARDLKLPR